MSLQSITACLDTATCCTIKGTPREEDAAQAKVHNAPLDQTVDVGSPGILQKAPVSSMSIGRLRAIPNWDAASPSSAASDDSQSLTDAEWGDLEDRHNYKLRPLWPENISETLPSELRPFLLSRPIRPWHLQDHQTDVTGNHHSRTPSHVGHQTTLPNAGFQSPAGQHHTQTPFHAGYHTALSNGGFQPPAGQYYTWPPPPIGLHHPKGQNVGQMPSRVKSQPLPGPHYYWDPSLGASGMAPPSNVTYPYATNTGCPPGAQFHPPANASTAPLPSTKSSRHRAYIPDKKK